MHILVVFILISPNFAILLVLSLKGALKLLTGCTRQLGHFVTSCGSGVSSVAVTRLLTKPVVSAASQ